MALREAPGGPDLGTIIVRLAIFVDPTDAHLIVVSDPFPTSAAGSLVGVRSLALTVDRRRFTFNPTSCGTHELRALVSASDGSSASASGTLQTSGCSSLDFRPRLSLSVGGRREMRDGGHPSLRALVRARRGDANLRELALRLPLSLALSACISFGGKPPPQFLTLQPAAAIPAAAGAVRAARSSGGPAC